METEATDPSDCDVLRKRLQYRANHRGIKEMDIILGGFAAARIDRMPESGLAEFAMLMEESDRDLLNWFTGTEEIPHAALRPMFDMILAYTHEQKL